MNFFRRRNSKSKKDELIKSQKLPPSQAPPKPPQQPQNKKSGALSASKSSTHTKHPPNYNFQHYINDNDINTNPSSSPVSSNNNSNVYHSLNSETEQNLNDIKKPNKFLSTKTNNNIKRNNSYDNDNDDSKYPPDLHLSLPSDPSYLSQQDSLQSQYSNDGNDDNTPSSTKRRSSNRLSSKHKRKNKSKFHSRSISNSSIGISARSMVSISNSALSLLDYDIERTDVESACCTLMDLSFSIRAVWVVARPIDRASLATRRFEHWAVKIHAQPALISMDFFECGGKGAFGISSVCASWTELEDFLLCDYLKLFLFFFYQTIENIDNTIIYTPCRHYHFTDYETQKQVKQPWKILSSVVPRKYDKMTNLEKHMLPLEIGKQTMSKTNENDNNGINRIKCDYKVRDLSDFIEEWVDDHQAYNSLGTNCQRFAYDVYNYLIGDYYPQKVKILDKHLQSPLDRQKEKLNRLKNNQDPNLKSCTSEEDDNHEYHEYHGDYKEEETNNETIQDNNIKENNMNDNGDKRQEEKEEKEVNNPEADVSVESLDPATEAFLNQQEENDNTIDID